MSVLDKMDTLVTRWGDTDRRSLFAGAYRSMSARMLQAIDADEFGDPVWVDQLLTSFADYYFYAVDASGAGPDSCPAVWRVAFDATVDDRIHPLRVLFLGINAHINYDLALCVADVMADWDRLDTEIRDLRRSDYDLVDTIICRTVDSVQDTVVGPASPTMVLLDRLLGPIDEWLFASLITRWRRDTWADGLSLLASTDDRIEEVRAKIEVEALDTADWILTVGPD
ncbi:MAG: DUF5995 family protein [Acidimicrobiia bacterium]